MKRSEFTVMTYEAGGSSESQSAWNPRNWTRRIWLILVTVILLIVVVIVGTVVGVRATRNDDGANTSYPDYFKLNYTLIDTCESSWTLSCI
jgi:heme/copper-type cytochrome/quinol oxidase subunit 2